MTMSELSPNNSFRIFSFPASMQEEKDITDLRERERFHGEEDIGPHSIEGTDRQ